MEMERIDATLTNEIEKILTNPLIEKKIRLERANFEACSVSPQPPGAKRFKAAESTKAVNINNVRKTIVEKSDGSCYAEIQRHVDLDLHEDTFLMMKLVKDENAKIYIEVSGGTFNSKNFYTICETLPVDSEDAGKTRFESELKMRTKQLFHGEHTTLSIVKLSGFKNKLYKKTKLRNELEKIYGGVFKDIGIEGYVIAIDIQYCENILKQLFTIPYSPDIFDKAVRAGLSNELYENLPHLNDTTVIHPVLIEKSVLNKTKQMIETLKELTA